MNLLEKILLFLASECERPQPYGRVHLIAVLAMIFCTFLIVLCFCNASERVFRGVLFAAWVLMLLFEIYKEIVIGLTFDGKDLQWNYVWRSFPFQFCSIPLYLLPFAAFLPNGRMRDGVLTFLAAYAMLGGLCVYVYPTKVFFTVIGVNIQTMVHHGLQIALGCLIFAHKRRKLRFSSYLIATGYYLIAVAIAFGLNEWMYSRHPERDFNLFFINRHLPCDIPFIAGIYEKISYPLFLTIYVTVFIAGGLLAFLTARGCRYHPTRND